MSDLLKSILFGDAKSPEAQQDDVFDKAWPDEGTLAVADITAQEFTFMPSMADVQVERLNDEFAVAARLVDGLMNLTDAVEATLESGGLTPEAAAGIDIAYRTIVASAGGVDLEDVQDSPVIQDELVQVGGREQGTVYTVERFKKRVKKLGRWVIDVVAKVLDVIASYYEYVFENSGKLTKEIDDVMAELRNVNAGKAAQSVKFGGMNYLGLGKQEKMMRLSEMKEFGKRINDMAKSAKFNDIIERFGTATQNDLADNVKVAETLKAVEAIKVELQAEFLRLMGDTNTISDRKNMNRLGFGGKRKTGETIYTEVRRSAPLPGGQAIFAGIPVEGGESFVSIKFAAYELDNKMRFVDEAQGLAKGEIQGYLSTAKQILKALELLVKERNKFKASRVAVIQGIRNVVDRSAELSTDEKSDMAKLRSLVDDFSNVLNSVANWYKGHATPAFNLAKAMSNYCVASAKAMS